LQFVRKILKFFAIGFSLIAIGVTSTTGALALSPEATWPAACLKNGSVDYAMVHPDHPGADQAHTDLGAGMNMMMANMMAGATASDIDVAFVCAMIPHHQGAIAMAEAALKHGDDPFVRALAEQVIAAQNQEITDMLNWLEGQK
jgi:Domain of unknown function (DUF305)